MKTQVEMLNVEDIEVLPFVWRESYSDTEDRRLVESIRKGGVQEPLVVVRDGERTLLVKGTRRIRAAKELGLPKVRAVIDPVTPGIDPETYIRRLRFILMEHRQDLIPSVRAGVIVRLKSELGLNNRQVSAYLGIDQDTITNWLAVKAYLPEVVSAIDAGAMTMQAARVFNGLSEQGQQTVWKKHRTELTGTGAGGAMKRIRSLYPPERFPAFYGNADAIAARLKHKSGKRKSRVTYTADEKKVLLSSVEMKEAEHAELKEEAAMLKRLCVAAGPVVSAILRNKETARMVGESMRAELERFAEVY